MSHSNIAIFIPHKGCPHACSFAIRKVFPGTEAGDAFRRPQGTGGGLSSPSGRKKILKSPFWRQFYLHSAERDGSVFRGSRPLCSARQSFRYPYFYQAGRHLGRNFRRLETLWRPLHRAGCPKLRRQCFAVKPAGAYDGAGRKGIQPHPRIWIFFRPSDDGGPVWRP